MHKNLIKESDQSLQEKFILVALHIRDKITFVEVVNIFGAFCKEIWAHTQLKRAMHTNKYPQ